jgi:hypothetical protein
MLRRPVAIRRLELQADVAALREREPLLGHRGSARRFAADLAPALAVRVAARANTKC